MPCEVVNPCEEFDFLSLQINSATNVKWANLQNCFTFVPTFEDIAFLIWLLIERKQAFLDSIGVIETGGWSLWRGYDINSRI